MHGEYLCIVALFDCNTIQQEHNAIPSFLCHEIELGCNFVMVGVIELNTSPQ